VAASGFLDDAVSEVLLREIVSKLSSLLEGKLLESDVLRVILEDECLFT